VINEQLSLKWKMQEPPFDHPDSCNYFKSDGSKSVVATKTATEEFTEKEISTSFFFLQKMAKEHNGLDHLQIFEDKNGRRLWFIEDGQAITAMLPEDY